MTDYNDIFLKSIMDFFKNLYFLNYNYKEPEKLNLD